MINWRLKRVLANKELTQIELIVETSEVLGVKQQTVRSVMTGWKRAERIEVYVADRLGVSRDYLFSSRKPKKSIARNK